jgi:penicillin-insensitive murein endopeptidase
MHWVMHRVMHRAMRTIASAAPAALAVMLCVLLWGCLASPTPLAPSIVGSVGKPHAGVLTNGKALPHNGEGFRRLRGDDIRWGNPRLVDAIERAASQVAKQRPGGAPVIIGDLSGRHGGAIQRHRSHRTGRDADLLLYALTPDGRPVANDGFIRFGRDGLARTQNKEFVRIDLERNWLLVKALTLDESAQVQWLFVARWLEALLIEYARARGEDHQTVWQAENLLRQPSDSFSHDDHIHLRIACTPSEEAGGCISGGYRWPWLHAPLQLQVSDDQLLSALFDDGDAS